MSQEQTTYELIGGAEKLRELVDRFYDLMDLEENYQGIRLMHPADSTSSREKLFMFLSGWMGGPDLFVQQYGHPRLKARHLPFSIGISVYEYSFSITPICDKGSPIRYDKFHLTCMVSADFNVKE